MPGAGLSDGVDLGHPPGGGDAVTRGINTAAISLARKPIGGPGQRVFAVGGSAPITVLAGRVAGAPKGFLERPDRAAVLVTANGPIVALGASTSGGANGLAFFGSAVGVPVPSDVLGDG